MRILQLCHKPPYPANDGGTRAMHANTLAFQALGHQVDIITLETPKHPILWEDIPNDYLINTNLEVHFENTTPSNYRALISFISGDNYHISRFDVPEFHALISKKLADKQYDIIWFESLYTAPYLTTVRTNAPNAKCIYRAHNVEHQLWQSRLNDYPAYLRPVIKKFNKKLRQFEFQTINNMDGIAVIAEEDGEEIRRISPEKPITTLSYFPWNENHNPNQEPHNNLVRYIGALDWEPNIQAVQWLVKEVWPKVIQELPEAQLEIAGRNMIKELLKLNNKTVKIIGEVADSEDYMNLSTVLVSPLFTGGGIRIKLIEAAALGVPVIATEQAVKGLKFSTNAIHIENNADSFAKAICELLPDYSRRNAMSKTIQEEFNTYYSKEAYTDTLKNFITSIL